MPVSVYSEWLSALGADRAARLYGEVEGVVNGEVSERFAGRGSVVPGRNAGELGLANDGQGVYLSRQVNRNDAESTDDPANRALAFRSETSAGASRT